MPLDIDFLFLLFIIDFISNYTQEKQNDQGK